MIIVPYRNILVENGIQYHYHDITLSYQNIINKYNFMAITDLIDSNEFVT